MDNNSIELTQSQIRGMIVDFRFEEQLRQILKNKNNHDQLNGLLDLSYSTNVIERHRGIIGIRKILSVNQNPPVQMIMDLGILPLLKWLMIQGQYPQLKLQAAWILTNISAGTRQQCRAIVELGAIPLFIDLLRQKEAQIIQQGLWGIGNISADCVQHRNAIIDAGGVKALIQVLQKSSNQNVVKECAWALSCLCRGIPLPSRQMIAAAIPPLCRLLVEQKIKDKTILGDICWAIQYHSKLVDDRKVILNSGAIPYLIQLVDEPSLAIKMPVLKALANITIDQDTPINLLILQRLLPKIPNLLFHSKNSIWREVCRLISNLAAGNMEYADSLLGQKAIIDRLFQFFGNYSKELKTQLCILFRNICENGDTAKVLSLFKNRHIVGQIVPYLDRQGIDLKNAALGCLRTILSKAAKQAFVPGGHFADQFRSYGGMGHLQQLKCYHGDEIYQQACIIQELLTMQEEE